MHQAKIYPSRRQIVVVLVPAFFAIKIPGAKKQIFVWPKILIEFESLAMETLEFSIEVTIGKE